MFLRARGAFSKSLRRFYSGFSVVRQQDIPELQLTAHSLQHDKTGAEILHLETEDNDNVSGILLPTPLNGVPTGEISHILEHLTLCGSQRYPVRRAFFKMLDRSLATFINAMTHDDWTLYPFSTKNKSDFTNLMDVYLDAVFRPNLDILDFKQEGWRLEHKTISDKESPFAFKGVVFNEMKGAYSNPDYLYVKKLHKALLPDLPGSTDDPLTIPSLSHQVLKQYHSDHYHPTNAKFFFYGDTPIGEHLEILGPYLNQFERAQPLPEFPVQPRWTEPRQHVVHCMPDPLAPDQEKQTTVSCSYLLEDITDVYHNNVFSVISDLLVRGENAPFYKYLVETGIGNGYSPAAGFNPSTKQATFSIGLQNVKKEAIGSIQRIINSALEHVIFDGFKQRRIDALLHEIELDLKHRKTHFGLHLLFAIASAWRHGASPFEVLSVNKFLDEFKSNLVKDPRYLQDIVKQHWKENPHRLLTVMTPKEAYLDDLNAREQAAVDEQVARLSSDDKAQIFDLGLTLDKIQSRKEDASCLPTLKVQDIDRKVEHVDLSRVDIGQERVQICHTATNGVVYFHGLLDASKLSPNLQPYVPLFAEVLTKMGAGDLDFREFAEKEQLTTGGLHAATFVAPHHSEASMRHGIYLSSHCLEGNFEAMLSLWNKVFNALKLNDLDRFRTLIGLKAAELSAGLSQMGHSYAMTFAASSLRGDRKLDEVYSGVTLMRLLKRLTSGQQIDQSLEKVVQIGKSIFTRSDYALNFTKSQQDVLLPTFENFLESIPEHEMMKLVDGGGGESFKGTRANTHINFPFEVNYIAQCIPTVAFSHPDWAKLQGTVYT